MAKKSNTQFQMIADFDGDSSILYGDLESGNYPMLCTRNVVMFPTVISPVLVGREQSTNLMRMLQKKEDPVLCVFCQKDENVDNPTLDDMYREGVFAKLLRVMELPGGDGNVNAIIQALGPARLVKINRRMPYYTAAVEAVEEEIPEEGDTQFDTLLAELREKTIEYIKADDSIPNEAEFALKNITNKVMLPNFICANMPFSAQEKMDLLSTHSLVDRVYQILKLEDRNISLLRLQQEIRQKTRNDLDAQQREYFLQQQLKNIKEELGDDYGSPERKELYEKAETKKWPQEVHATFMKELDKLEMLNPQSPEYSVQFTYLQTMVALPWNEYTQDDLDIKRAKRILDKDHYGMEKVKERILEYLAVLKLRGDLKSPIICLYGPPGVGKTSLGKSIAEYGSLPGYHVCDGTLRKRTSEAS